MVSLAVWQFDLQVVPTTGAPRTKTSESAKLPLTTLAVDNRPRARPVGPTTRPEILEIDSKGINKRILERRQEILKWQQLYPRFFQAVLDQNNRAGHWNRLPFSTLHCQDCAHPLLSIYRAGRLTESRQASTQAKSQSFTLADIHVTKPVVRVSARPRKEKTNNPPC